MVGWLLQKWAKGIDKESQCTGRHQWRANRCKQLRSEVGRNLEWPLTEERCFLCLASLLLEKVRLSLGYCWSHHFSAQWLEAFDNSFPLHQWPNVREMCIVGAGSGNGADIHVIKVKHKLGIAVSNSHHLWDLSSNAHFGLWCGFIYCVFFSSFVSEFCDCSKS